MTIQDFLKQNNSIEADILLQHVLKCTKEFLFLEPKFKLSVAQENKLRLLALRRVKGEPIAYLSGSKEFFGLKFKVNKNVLIPRPESEWLVDRAVEVVTSLLKAQKNSHVLEIGTGSGCISVSLAKLSLEKPTKFTATDVSTKALEVARANAKTHKVDINFLESDLLAKLHGSFDIIIANLPYVPISDYLKYLDNLKYEPKIALTDGTVTSSLYKKLIEQIAQKKNKPKFILLEFDPTTKPIIKKLVREHLPTYSVAFHKDLQNLWRYAIVKEK